MKRLIVEPSVKKYKRISAKWASLVPFWPSLKQTKLVYYDEGEIAGTAILDAFPQLNFTLEKYDNKYRMVNKLKEHYVIERPAFLDEESGMKMLSAIKVFVREKNLDAHLYDRITSSIFFPSTLKLAGVWNSLYVVPVFEKFGFEQINKQFCYEGEVKDFGIEEDGGISFRNINLEDPRDTSNYMKLWSLSRYCTAIPYTTDYFKPKWMLPSTLLFSGDYIIFLSVKGKEIGFVQWWPNLYRLFNSGNQYFTPEEGIEATKSINEGKIFKVVVKKEYEGCGYEEMLCKKAIQRMKEQGFKRYQFGNISESDKVLKDVAKNLNCRMVNSLLFMRDKR